MDNQRKKIDRKTIVLLVIFFVFGFYTLIEDRIQDFSPFKQIINSVGLPVALTGGFIFVLLNNKNLSNPASEIGILKWILGRILIGAVFGFLIAIPSLGIISLLNRTLPPQTDYILKGQILEIDSSQIHYKGSSREEYSIEIRSKEMDQTYKFDITYDDYKVWQDSSNFQSRLKRGKFGYLYLIK